MTNENYTDLYILYIELTNKKSFINSIVANFNVLPNGKIRLHIIIN